MNWDEIWQFEERYWDFRDYILYGAVLIGIVAALPIWLPLYIIGRVAAEYSRWIRGL